MESGRSSGSVEFVEHGGGRRQLLRRWPTASPRAVVTLVHGYAEHSGRYGRTARLLADAGFSVWSTDLQGHGGSSGERATVARLDDLVRDARVALDRAAAVHPGAPEFLVGHSMGGLVATRLALDVGPRLRGLVLSGAAVGDPEGIAGLLDLDPLPEVALDSALLSRDPQVARDYDGDPLNYRGPFRRETLRTLTDGAREVRGRWGELATPVLVLHGGDDAIVPPAASEDLHAGVSSLDRSLEILPGLRHEILNEPEGPEVVRRIAAWIAERL